MKHVFKFLLFQITNQSLKSIIKSSIKIINLLIKIRQQLLINPPFTSFLLKTRSLFLN